MIMIGAEISQIHVPSFVQLIYLSTISLQSVLAGMSSVETLLHQQPFKNKQLHNTFFFLQPFFYLSFYTTTREISAI